MAAIASKLPQNLGRNRYRDISACKKLAYYEIEQSGREEEGKKKEKFLPSPSSPPNSSVPVNLGFFR